MTRTRNALTQSLADGRYLKLDATNDPITNQLEVDSLFFDFENNESKDLIDLDIDLENYSNLTFRGIKIDILSDATSGAVFSSNYYPIDINMNMDFNGADFHFVTDLTALKVNYYIDPNVSVTNLHLIKVTGNKVADKVVNIDIDGTGQSSQGLFYVRGRSSGTSGLIACRTASLITSSSNSATAIGYQGYASNSDASGNGATIAMQPFLYACSGNKFACAIKPTATGGVPSAGRLFAFHSNGIGDVLLSQSGLLVTSTAYSEVATSNPASHITWGASGDGCGYFEKDIESDGRIWCDGQLRIPVKSTTGDPSSPEEGDIYLNTNDNVLKIYEGGSWRTIASW